MLRTWVHQGQEGQKALAVLIWHALQAAARFPCPPLAQRGLCLLEQHCPSCQILLTCPFFEALPASWLLLPARLRLHVQVPVQHLLLQHHVQLVTGLLLTLVEECPPARDEASPHCRIKRNWSAFLLRWACKGWLLIRPDMRT